MRERIRGQLSEYFRNEVLLPGIVKDYEVGFQEMILLNQAFAIMLAKEKIIDSGAAGQILQGLDEVKKELKLEALDGNYEDIYFNVEQALFKKTGVKVGGKLHTGRSRNDLHATFSRMAVRKSLWEVFDKLIALQEESLKAASENLETVITGYTHMQPAQPITLGHYYSAVSNVLSRGFGRLQHAYNTTNLCPYGTAALAGTRFPINRQLLNDLLGFEQLLMNSLDAVGSRDFILEIESAFSIMVINISRIAQDHYIWCTDEFGVLDVGGEIAICSSIMPQKKNPVSFEFAKAKAGHSVGALMSTLAVLKNIPFSLCIDLFEAAGLFWEARAQVLQGLHLMADNLRFSKINRERALARARSNFSTVTALADALVARLEISFSEAHNIVGRMVAQVHEDGSLMGGMKGVLLKRISKEVLGQELALTEEEIQKILDPKENVESKKVAGGPSRGSVQKMLEETREYLKAEREWLKEEKERVDKAYTELEREKERLISGIKR